MTTLTTKLIPIVRKQGSLDYLQSYSTPFFTPQKQPLPFSADETRHWTLALSDLHRDITQKLLNFLRINLKGDLISHLELEK
jgi:hypothetical protein